MCAYKHTCLCCILIPSFYLSLSYAYILLGGWIKDRQSKVYTQNSLCCNWIYWVGLKSLVPFHDVWQDLHLRNLNSFRHYNCVSVLSLRIERKQQWELINTEDKSCIGSEFVIWVTTSQYFNGMTSAIWSLPMLENIWVFAFYRKWNWITSLDLYLSSCF